MSTGANNGDCNGDNGDWLVLIDPCIADYFKNFKKEKGEKETTIIILYKSFHLGLIMEG